MNLVLCRNTGTALAHLGEAEQTLRAITEDTYVNSFDEIHLLLIVCLIFALFTRIFLLFFRPSLQSV